MKRLVISRTNYIKIIKHCQQKKPDEACGIMTGICMKDDGIVKEVNIMNNLKKSSKEYLMDPEEQFAVFKRMRDNNLKLISIYHSHPDTKAVPSLKDIEMAYYKEALYSIISLKEEQPVFRVFSIDSENYHEKELEIKEG